MKIICALSESQVEKLYANVYGKMFKALEEGKTFDPKVYMQDLFDKISSAKDDDTAAKFLQQVPSLMFLASSKNKLLSLKIDTNFLRDKIQEFKGTDEGITNTLKFFKGEVDPETAKALSEAKELDAFELKETDPEEDKTYNEVRLKPFSAFTTTFQEFETLNPNYKDAFTQEDLDQSKTRIYKAISKIREEIGTDTTLLDEVKFQGRVIKLTPFKSVELDQSKLDNYTKKLIIRSLSITKAGTQKENVTPTQNIISLVITDQDGNPLFFDEEGNITTAENGKIIQQFMRDVRLDKGKYQVTNVYGDKTNVQSPTVIARLEGISLEEAEKRQQEEFKELFDLKQDILSGKNVILDIGGVSAGVDKASLTTRLPFPVLRTMSVGTREVFKSITLADEFSKFKTGSNIITINNQDFNVDRATISETLAKKIASVLTNRSLTPTEKNDYVAQFLSNKITESSRRHYLLFDPQNKRFVFEYDEFTLNQRLKDGISKKQTINLRDLRNYSDAELATISDTIFNVLTKASSRKTDKELTEADYFGTKIVINNDKLKSGLYKDYDINTGKLIDGQSYIDFIAQEKFEVLLNSTTDPGLFNSYFHFRMPSAIAKEADAGKKNLQQQESRSRIRQIKDATVDLLYPDNLSKEVTVSYSDMGMFNEQPFAYFLYTTDIPGFEGQVVKVYMDMSLRTNKEILPKIGDRIILTAEDNTEFGGIDVVAYNADLDRIGVQQETDFKAGEAQRDYTVLEETKELQNEVDIEETLDPTDTENPDDENSGISDLFNLDRKGSLPNNVTQEDIDNARKWWEESPLSKFIGLNAMANIVNSDAYARFTIAGENLTDARVLINAAKGGTMVDVYHESWHAFSQLYLTKAEKIKLYEELRNSKAEYKKLSFFELEEILAEDFRDYALNQKRKENSPKRNSIFRKIWNFLKNLFSSKTYKNELYNALYLAGKNPKLLNKYTPLIDNVMFDMLNRGAAQVSRPSQPALSLQDSNKVVASMDSIISEVVDDIYTDKKNKSQKLDRADLDHKGGTIKILADPSNKVVLYDTIIKGRLKKKLKEYRKKLGQVTEVSFDTINTVKELANNSVAVLTKQDGTKTYVFLNTQVDSYANISLDTLDDRRIKGQTYDGVDIITDFYSHNTIKDSNENPVDIMLVPDLSTAITQFENYRMMGEDYTGIEVKQQPEYKPLNSEQLDLLDKIRILQAAVDNFGDASRGMVKYHMENSRFDIIRDRYVELDDVTDAESLESSDRAGGKVETGTESLEQLASKETLYILSSLHKKVNGKTVEDSLGFKQLADFRTMFNGVAKLIVGVKDPVEQYRILKDAISIYPEFEQLITYKMPEPLVDASANVNRNEFKITTAFYRDFGRKAVVDYIQNTIFENGTIEVVTSSVSIGNLLNKFEQNFISDISNPFVVRGTDNAPVLNLKLVIDEFADKSTGKLNPKLSSEFARAIGIKLDFNDDIEAELAKDNAASYYGLPYIFEFVKKLYDVETQPGFSVDAKKVAINFKKSPISVLRGKVPAGVITDREFSQLTQLKRLAELQVSLGADGNIFSTKNPEGNTVYRVINDHSISMKIYALNAVTKLDQLWTTDKFQYMSSFNPRVNPYTERLSIFKNLFDFTDSERTRRSGKSLKLFLSAGSQVNEEIGNKTTSLDVYGKFLQDLNSFLKGGVQEFMRHSEKSSAFGAMIDGGIIDGTGGTKKSPKLWVDVDKFSQNTAEQYALTVHLLPYIAGELDRINRFKANKEEFLSYKGYNEPMEVNSKGETIYAGELFTAFDNVLTKDTKNEIYKKVTSGDLIEYLKTDTVLLDKITKDVINYFNEQTQINLKYLQNSEMFHITPDLINSQRIFNLTDEQIKENLVKAYTYNSWIHNFETGILNYGDFVIYDHAKDVFHKRNSGASSNGTGARTDVSARRYVNNVLNETSYAASLEKKKTGDETYLNFTYDGTFNTAILEEIKKDSVYLPLYVNAFRSYYTKQYANTKKEDIVEWFTEEELSKIGNDINDLRKALVEKFVEFETEAYKKMEVADGQGYMTFDAYRTMKSLEGDWTDYQEELFQKIVKGQQVTPSEIYEFFPVYKVQNFGPLADTKLPVEAMHKFSLMPLIPGMYPEGSNFDIIHKQMLKGGVQYATFQSGSKAGDVGVTKLFEADSKGSKILDKIDFISNRVYLDYIKTVANMSNYFKGKTIYASQARGIVLDGLFDKGDFVHETLKDQYNNYKGSIADLREILEMELLEEIGFEKVNGKYKGNLTKFLSVVERELGRKEVPEHLIKFIGVNPDNTLKTDLSFHPNADEIEKLIVGMIQKRLVKQKVNGEAFIQVSSAFTQGIWDTELPQESIEEVLKFVGTTSLPFYYTKLDGKTAAPKVAIAIQGDFQNLYNLQYKGEPIGNLERLNIALKDDGWLDDNNGANRQAVTLFSVRIPIDSLGTMLYPEVYHFLPAAAGNAIIVPDELVASSGGDFDGDKLTTSLPNINKFGKLYKKTMSNKELLAEVKKLKAKGENGKAMQLIKNQKKAIENNLIKDVRSILEAPENFVNLIKPNGTYYFKPLAEKLEPIVSDYNKFKNMHGETVRTKGGKKAMSATRVLEARHNLNKFQKNLEGRKSLGTTAINNKLNPVLNSSAAKLPFTYKETLKYNDTTKKYEEGSRNYKTRVFLPHNTITIDGITYISLSNNYAADNIANIGTSFSHKLNGQLDVGKDDWIFNIQSNPQIEPISSHLSEAGVPIASYIYFISNPLVRQYAEKQRIYNSPYARFTGNVLTSPAFAKYQSSKDVLEQYIPELIEQGLQNAPEEVFVNYYIMKPYTDQFTGKEEEVRQYISKMMSKSDLMNQIDAGIIDINKITVISKDKSGQYGYRNAYYVNPVPTNKNYYDLSTYYSSLPSVLNSKGEFDLKKMKDIAESPNDSKHLYDKIAMFIHFLELEKQVKGVDSLKRQMNPDTKVDKTTQEIDRRNVSLEELNDMSKLDPETKRRATEESVLAPFFDNTIIVDIVKQVFPFRNTDKITDYIVKVLRTNYGDITKKYGYGQDGVSKFITNFKNAVSNYVYQNNMPDLFDPEGNLITFSNMTASGADSYTSKLFDMIKKHLRGNKIKRTYSILEQLATINTKGKPSQRSITLNDRADLKGSLADIYYNNLKDLANPNIKKVTNPDVNNYISQMFALLPQISMYLNGQGYSPYGINNALPFDEYVSIMERSSGEFLSEQVNEDVLNTVYKKLMKDYSVFKNYKAEPLVESLPADVPAFTPDLLDVETSEDVLPTAEDFETGELVTRKTFTVETPSLQEISPTEKKPTVTVVSEPYGVVVAETNPSEAKTQEFVNLIQPQIQVQAYKENASGTANDMFMYGLRWTRKRTAIAPLNNKSYANKGLPITDAKATDGYVYDTVDQNGNALAPVSDLQPIIEEIQNAIGIDMSNYDAVIGNIYLPGQNIATHRDTTESLSARNYPVVVYTIGNNSGIGIYEDKTRPGAPTFASDSKRTIPTKNGSIYTFGMDGKGRFELAHDTPKGITRDQKFPPITLPNGAVVENYTITLTFRRAADLEPGMPTTPSKKGTAPTQPTVEPVGKVKEGVTELFESNPELARIGTPEQYSAYLDTIFPDSKVKDIVYHGTDRPEKTFEKRTPLEAYGSNAIYFANEDYAATFGNLIPAVLNITNPFISEQKFMRRRLKPGYQSPQGTVDAKDLLSQNKNNDGLVGVDYSDQENNTYVIREPEQIHILGSKQDIEGFKKFISKPTVKEITPPIPGGKNKLLSDADIERFNLEVARNNNLLPKTFTTSSTDQDAFANDISGKKPGSEEYNLWQLNPRGLYNLVDANTGEIYLRDVDLATGFQKEQVAPSTPVDEKLLKDTIKDLTDGIKEYRLDQIFALKGYDINDIIKKLEDAKTQEELIDTIVLIKKITC